MAASVWRHIPAALAASLLIYEIALPWTVRHFVTQDGPSHLYGASVLEDLVMHHKTSVYAPLYTVQRKVLPNWTSTFVLAADKVVAGTEHAEQLFASLAFALGFLAWCYAARAFDGTGTGWNPIAICLYQTWFLWIGFYNFYLGVAMMPFVIGFYAYREGKLTRRTTAMLAIAMLALFATHLIAAAATLLALGTMALWTHLIAPALRGERGTERRFLSREALRQLGLVLVVILPIVVLMALYAKRAPTHVKLDPQVAWAWKQFPMHIFLTAAGPDAMQKLMWKVLLGYAVLSVLLLKRREWASPRGGLVVATVLIFAAYLLVPDKGLGGTEAKIRFSWVFFVLLGLVTCVASRLRFLRVPAALIFAWFAFVNAQATARTAGAVSELADAYLAVAGRVTPGASLVRLRYPTPHLAAEYGYEGVGRDPVFHLDALEATRKHGVDLSDYEALTEIFGVIYKPYLDKGQLSGLWSFEGPDPDSDKTLKWINDSFPQPVDFVLVVGDLRSPAAERMGMPKMMEYLESTMQPVAQSRDGMFRLFRKESVVGRR